MGLCYSKPGISTLRLQRALFFQLIGKTPITCRNQSSRKQGERMGFSKDARDPKGGKLMPCALCSQDLGEMALRGPGRSVCRRQFSLECNLSVWYFDTSRK